MNIKLLHKIQTQILKEPRQFDMRDWFTDQSEIRRKIPNCGTAACIGGWALVLSNETNPEKESMRVSFEGGLFAIAPLLGLDWREEDRLCHVISWPDRFQKAWNKTKSLPKRARIACRRIDHFIKTKGKE